MRPLRSIIRLVVFDESTVLFLRELGFAYRFGVGFASFRICLLRLLGGRNAYAVSVEVIFVYEANDLAQPIDRHIARLAVTVLGDDETELSRACGLGVFVNEQYDIRVLLDGARLSQIAEYVRRHLPCPLCFLSPRRALTAKAR